MTGTVAEVAFTTVCWLLAAVFAVALRHKTGSWPRFKAAFAAYRIVPERSTSACAAIIVAAESVALINLLLLQGVGLIIAAGLLVIYAVAIGVNLKRGRRQIDCGCGDEPTPLSRALVVRNCVLVALAAGAYALPVAFTPAWQTAMVAAAAALVAFGIYSAIEQLLVNRGRHARLWLGVS